MKYTTYKSKSKRYGLPALQGEKGTRHITFENHTLLVPDYDTELIEYVEGIIKREIEIGTGRNIYTPEEFAEIITPENAYFEHKTQGKIPTKRVSKMIDFALEHGYKDEEEIIEVKKVGIEQGTTTTGTQIKNNKPK
jgi:hypothetical protein